MHKQGKIHRDIKGANILLTTEGDIKLGIFIILIILIKLFVYLYLNETDGQVNK